MARGSKSNSFQDVLNKYAANLEEEKYPTGIDSLDELLNGGVPFGKMMAFWGAAGSGKSTLALQIAKHFCKDGYKVALIDVERAFNQSQQEAFGLRKYVEDGTMMVFDKITTYSDCDEICQAILESGEFKLLIIDSETALLPKVPKDMAVDDMQPGQKAKQASILLTKIKTGSEEAGCTVIMIAHARANIQMGFATNPNAAPDKMAGGYAQKHIPDAILRVAAGAKVKEDDKQIGQMIYLEFEKNKFAPPFQRIQKKFIYGVGISKRIDIIDTAIERGLIKQSSSFFTMPWGETIRGTKNMYAMSNEQLKQLQQALKE